MISNRLNEILYNVFNLLKINLPHSDESTTDSRLKVAIEFIKENKNRSISCEDVARECCLSSKQLNRIFKKHTQKTVNDFLTDSRISYAKSLILQKRIERQRDFIYVRV